MINASSFLFVCFSFFSLTLQAEHTIDSSYLKPRLHEAGVSKPKGNVHSYDTASYKSIKVALSQEAANDLYDFLKYGTPFPTSVPIGRPALLEKGGLTCLYENDSKTYICEFVVSDIGEIRREQSHEQVSSVKLNEVSQAIAKSKFDQTHGILTLSIEGESAENIYNLLRYGKSKPEAISVLFPSPIQKGAIECSYSRETTSYTCRFSVNRHGISGVPVE